MIDALKPKVYELEDGIEVVLDVSGDGPPTLYRVVGETKNPRAMAGHDGPVLLDDRVVDVFYKDEHGWFQVQHHWTGLEERYLPGEWTEQPAKRLQRVVE